MSIFTLKKTGAAKAVSIFAGAAMALTLVFGGAVAPAQAQTVEELTAQISSLLAMITSLQAQLSGIGGGTTTTGVSYSFTKNLSSGDSGADVLNLQKVLNMSTDTQVAATGVGSTGLETEYFGGLTKVAVIKFQNKYASEILTPVGLTAGTGFVGPSTRAKLNTMTTTTGGGTTVTFPAGCTSAVGFSPTTGVACDGSGSGSGTVVVVPTGTGLTVSAGVQPAATLAVMGAARVPFTKVVLTASADGDVVINSLLVERTGLAQDAAFAGIVLLNEDGTQIGIAKTLNSLHQATVGENFTVKAGTSKMITIAANMHSTMSGYTGQVGSLTVVGVNTSATVSGALPIVGASHTMNGSLTIGTATPARGINDPNTDATKEVGVTDYTFSSVKVTAGSAEKLRIHSIRWNQSGSASASDFGNLKTYVDGTAYDVMVSADGKYYTSSFGSGLVVDKGLSKEMTIKGDILSGSGRTIAFDLYKNTDLYVTGETFGYGITPVDVITTFDGTPWYDASEVTVSNGSLVGSKATTIESQNIAKGVANQVLGGFDIEAKGEAVSVASMVFDVNLSSYGTNIQVENITNISLVDANGLVVAGPVDGVGTSGAEGTITFTDTVTFALGEATYTLKGQIGTSFTNDVTIIIDTNPTDDWTTVTGQTTGNSITPTPDGILTSNTMTIKTGSATIYTSASPVDQNIVAGAQGFTFANYQFDATASGEDVRFTSLILELVTTGHSEYLTGCQLWDGDTALNTGSNVKDIAAGGTDLQTFTLDSGGLVIPKGTVVKPIALKCDLSSSANGETYLWKISAEQSGTGLDSGTTITVGTGSISGSGQTMTATTGGTFTVVKDDSSPAYDIVAAGTTDVVLAQLKFTGVNEAINLKKVGLQLTAASSSASDLTRVTLWDGTTQVGVATFTNDYATSTLTTDFVIPKDGSRVMTIKGDLAQIGTSQVGTQGALLKVNYDSDLATGTQGVGVQSGQTISTSSITSDTEVDGVRVFRAYPEFAKIDVDSTVLISTTEATLYKFSVTAKDADGASDGIGISRFAVNVATSTASSVSGTTTVTNLAVYAYTDSSFSSPVSGYTNGLLRAALATVNSGDNEINFSTSILNIPAGLTYYFKVIGDTVLTAGSGTFSGNVTTRISGDTAYPTNAVDVLVDSETNIAGDTNGDLVWSPHATTTSILTHLDWTNGYMVDGLPSGGSTATTISK